jgi:hypothetical protein
MEELIKKYQEAQTRANEIYNELSEHSDGFIYLTCLRCYGSISWNSHKNSFLVQELCDEYYGDNGIVHVYTNNTNHKISSYGSVKVMTEQEILNMSKENISMSSAISMWISRGL